MGRGNKLIIDAPRLIAAQIMQPNQHIAYPNLNSITRNPRLNNFPPTVSKIQPKTNKKNPQFFFLPNKKKFMKKPLLDSCLAGCLGSSQGLSLLKSWDWETKTCRATMAPRRFVFCWAGWKNITISKVSWAFPEVLLVCFFFLGVLEKNHTNPFPKWWVKGVIHGMETSYLYSVKSTKEVKGLK